MKIGQTRDTPADKAGAAAARTASEARSAPAQQARAQAPAAQTPGVAVTVSPALERTVRSTAGDVDMNKVNAVRQAIADGTFQINAEVIADRMLSNAAEMLRLSRG